MIAEAAIDRFSTLDWFILAAYFAVIILTGIAFTRRQRSTDDYFRAGGGIPMAAAAVSFLATALSAATFIGGPQQSFRGDLSYLSSNIGSLIAVLVVAVVFVPAFYRHKVATVYELLARKFGESASFAASVAFLIGRLFASGARLYIAALPASLIIFGDISVRHQFISIAAFTVVGILYTYSGGIRTVIWTDVVQTVIFVGAAAAALIILLDRIPLAIPEIIHTLQSSAVGGSSKLTILKPGLGGFGPEHTYTLLTAVFGFSLLSLGAYGTDQDLAQRLLTCRNAVKGSWSAILGVVLGLPVTALFMAIGLLLYIFYMQPGLMGMAAPGYAVGESRKVFLTFILAEMPRGMSGLMLAGLFAAGLSSLNSAINAMSSSFINDLYHWFRPNRTDVEYLRIGKRVVWVFGLMLGGFAVFSVLWQRAKPETTLIDFALMVMVFAYSGMSGVFLTAVLTRRGNTVSVIAALATGFISVLLLQFTFADQLAFPWRMFIATSLSFLVCTIGKRRPVA